MDDMEKSTAFVMGALSPAEREGVSRERLYNRALDALIVEQEMRHAPLTGAAGEMAPPAHLLQSIMGAAAASGAIFADGDYQAFSDGGWQDHSPGIEFKNLWSEKTLVLRCSAGAQDAAHPQDEDEHIMVIAGDLVIAGRTLGIGDYFMAKAGTTHPQMTTNGGCILFTQYI